MAETQSDKTTIKVSVGAATTAAPTPSVAADSKSGAKGGYWWATGRRKTSVARVRIRPGTGTMLINERQLNDYFKADQDRKAVLSPLQAIGGEKSFDVFINIAGGGTTGQAGASMLGIARALKKYDPNYLQALRDGNYLTRDPRMVERKKPGQSGARKRYQFSKR